MPSYYSTSITETTADFIIVPVTLDGTAPRDGPHKDLLFHAGDKYFQDYDDKVLTNRYVLGDSKTYFVTEGAMLGRWIFQIPVGPTIPFDRFQSALRSGFVDATTQNVECVAVPYFNLRGINIPTSVQDALLVFLETTILAPRDIALEVYTYPNLNLDSEDEPTTITEAIRQIAQEIR